MEGKEHMGRIRSEDIVEKRMEKQWVGVEVKI